MATLLVFSLDAEAFALIPILADLKSHYSLSASQLTWTLALPALVGAGLIPVMARMGDMFGIRRMLLIAAGAAAVGTVLCAVAQGPTLLIIGRAIIGVGGACLPLFYAYMRSQSRSSESVDFAAGFMTAIIGGGLIISFLLGGTIIKLGGSAQTVLTVIAALAVLGFALLWLLPKGNTKVKTSLDLVGAGLLIVALTIVALGLNQGNRWGWTSPSIITLLVLGIALLISWAFWELRTESPIIDLRVISRREVWPACVAAAFGSFLGATIVLTASQYMATPEQAGYGFGMSAFTIGLYFLPLGIIIGFGGLTIRPVMQRLGLRNTSALGGAITTISFIWFALDGNPTTTKYLIILICWGLAYVLTVSSAAAAYMRASRPGEEGMIAGGARVVATGLNGLGPAIVSALLTAAFIPKTHVPVAGNYNNVWWFIAACGVLVVAVSLLIRQTAARTDLASNAVFADDADRTITKSSA
ncbi:MFS transporter [Rhodococcus sp. OK302]|uniref:MFS transporter n=1 Tax=Rhodococcus sp. OK302 TaxID=1882769 RepID=UPI001595EB06|nr:MFS transporter [Rhodococcus sp. OK302]